MTPQQLVRDVLGLAPVDPEIERRLGPSFYTAEQVVAFAAAREHGRADTLTRLQSLEATARVLVSALKGYGFPVSEAHWENARNGMSGEARALHLAAKDLAAALDNPPASV